MNKILSRLWLLAMLLLALPAAQAAITCTSITSPGASISYVNNTTTSVQTFFTVSCTRSSPGDPNFVDYDVTADNGLYANGQNNNARLGAASLRYDVFTTAGCNTTWKGNRQISDRITWTGGATGTITKQTNFWACIVSATTATASGTFTDTVGLTLTYNNTVVSGSVPIRIYAPALCTWTTPPSDINLTYAAFGPQVSGSTTFRVTCTSGMPYTIATDVTEAVLTGVRYTLAVNAPDGTGTGAAQSYTITATIPANQAGTCAGSTCSGVRTHTLTISY
jgi:spore coat protein U-like protein